MAEKSKKNTSRKKSFSRAKQSVAILVAVFGTAGAVVALYQFFFLEYDFFVKKGSYVTINILSQEYIKKKDCETLKQIEEEKKLLNQQILVEFKELERLKKSAGTLEGGCETYKLKLANTVYMQEQVRTGLWHSSTQSDICERARSASNTAQTLEAKINWLQKLYTDKENKLKAQ